MLLQIDGKEFEFKIDFNFIRYFDKKLGTGLNNMKTTTNEVMLHTVEALVGRDPVVLADIIEAGTYKRNPKPTKQEIEEYIVNGGEEVDELYSDFFDYLTEDSILKNAYSQVMKILENSQDGKKTQEEMARQLLLNQ